MSGPVVVPFAPTPRRLAGSLNDFAERLRVVLPKSARYSLSARAGTFEIRVELDALDALGYLDPGARRDVGRALNAIRPVGVEVLIVFIYPPLGLTLGTERLPPLRRLA